MRVLVVGTGIIGSIYGWALTDSGHHVVHLVRSERAGTFRDGLPLDLFDRRKGHPRNFRGVYRVDSIVKLVPTDPFDLVIVPVKHYALEQTLREIVPQAGTAEFLLLTQNWRGVKEIDSILPRTRYVYGDAKAGGTFSAGTLVAALYAVDLGSPEGEPSPLARKAGALFASADILPRLHSDMLHYLWIQYAISTGAWAPLVHAGSLDAMRHERDWTSAALNAVRECLQVVERRGVTLSRYPETRPFLTDSVLRRRVYGWIMRWMIRRDEYTRRCTAHAFGDPVEIQTFYDDLVTTGHDLGVSMPLMESYGEDIHRLAAPAPRQQANVPAGITS